MLLYILEIDNCALFLWKVKSKKPRLLLKRFLLHILC